MIVALVSFDGLPGSPLRWIPTSPLLDQALILALSRKRLASLQPLSNGAFLRLQFSKH